MPFAQQGYFKNNNQCCIVVLCVILQVYSGRINFEFKDDSYKFPFKSDLLSDFWRDSNAIGKTKHFQICIVSTLDFYMSGRIEGKRKILVYLKALICCKSNSLITLNQNNKQIHRETKHTHKN